MTLVWTIKQSLESQSGVLLDVSPHTCDPQAFQTAGLKHPPLKTMVVKYDRGEEKNAKTNYQKCLF